MTGVEQKPSMTPPGNSAAKETGANGMTNDQRIEAVLARRVLDTDWPVELGILTTTGGRAAVPLTLEGATRLHAQLTRVLADVLRDA